MFLVFSAIIALSSDSLFGNSAATLTPLRSPRAPHQIIPNSDGDFSRAPSKPVMPDINLLVDHAEFALHSYLPSSEILKTLRRTKTNVRIIQRNLDIVTCADII